MLWKNARRLIIAVIGFTVLLIGIALIVLPGPAMLVIPAGLAILATEFIWAKRMLDRFHRGARSLFASGRAKNAALDEAAAAPKAGFPCSAPKTGTMSRPDPGTSGPAR
jgi:tellurite resistance protein TerC